MENRKVVVVGSLNCDLVMRVPRLPVPGETVLGSSFHTFVGGKGCNQAIAAARAGARVAMVGRVGADPFGDMLLAKLREEGVDCEHVSRDPEEGTGVADIFVGDAGDNAIAIAPRANGRLTPELVDSAAATFEGASSVLLQLEIPIETATRAAELGQRAGALVVLNPAPAPSTPLPAALLDRVSLVVPNQSEAEALTGVRVVDVQTAREAASRLSCAGRAVILTLGDQGVVELDDGRVEATSAFAVDVVDSTAAGDAFVGALVAARAGGRSRAAAIVFACAAGALACTKLGAEPSLPALAEIEALARTRCPP